MPVAGAERITNLDAIRGWATLGILLMNVVSFVLPDGAYYNLSAGGSDSALDWIIGGFGEVFVDQKMMGLFSLLFGAGVALFADRTAAKGERSTINLSLWRNVLLFGIGLLHLLLWEGDILTIYAGASLIVVLLRNQRPRTLIALGVAIFAVAVLVGFAVTPTVSANGTELADLWASDQGIELSGPVELWFLVDGLGRALAMMLIGVALFRMGVLDGTRNPTADRRMAQWGLGIGLPLAAAALAILALNDFDPRWFLPTHAMNTAATVPVVLGYVGIISLWNRRGNSAFHERIRAVGRMALTNYLTQTLLGVLLLANLVDSNSFTRTGALVFVLAVWGLQVGWSKPWLERFRFGPFEWAWRSLTYREVQPLRR